MTRTQTAKTAYRSGLLDGYMDNSPDVFFVEERDWLETERYAAGRSDGASLRELDEYTSTGHGLKAVMDLQLRSRPDFDPKLDYPERYA